MKNYQAIEDFLINRLRLNLPQGLIYHDWNHTFEVLQAAELIAANEKINDAQLFLLKVAVLCHDEGMIRTYKNHEAASCEFARAELPHFDLAADEIEIICGMIMATKIPQSPKNDLERIIADADLEYLGTDDFENHSQKLFEEAKIYLGVKNQHDWDEIQVKFLEGHHYHTGFCKKNQEPQKQMHLQQVKARL